MATKYRTKKAAIPSSTYSPGATGAASSVTSGQYTSGSGGGSASTTYGTTRPTREAPETTTPEVTGAVTRPREGGGTITVSATGLVTERDAQGHLIKREDVPTQVAGDYVTGQSAAISIERKAKIGKQATAGELIKLQRVMPQQDWRKYIQVMEVQKRQQNLKTKRYEELKSRLEAPRIVTPEAGPSEPTLTEYTQLETSAERKAWEKRKTKYDRWKHKQQTGEAVEIFTGFGEKITTGTERLIQKIPYVQPFVTRTEKKYETALEEYKAPIQSRIQTKLDTYSQKIADDVFAGRITPEQGAKLIRTKQDTLSASATKEIGLGFEPTYRKETLTTATPSFIPKREYEIRRREPSPIERIEDISPTERLTFGAYKGATELPAFFAAGLPITAIKLSTAPVPFIAETGTGLLRAVRQRPLETAGGIASSILITGGISKATRFIRKKTAGIRYGGRTDVYKPPKLEVEKVKRVGREIPSHEYEYLLGTDKVAIKRLVRKPLEKGLRIEYPRQTGPVQILGGGRPTAVTRAGVKYLGEKSMIRQITVGGKARGTIRTTTQDILYERLSSGKIKVKYFNRKTGKLKKTKIVKPDELPFKPIKEPVTQLYEKRTTTIKEKRPYYPTDPEGLITTKKLVKKVTKGKEDFSYTGKPSELFQPTKLSKKYSTAERIDIIKKDILAKEKGFKGARDIDKELFSYQKVVSEQLDIAYPKKTVIKIGRREPIIKTDVPIIEYALQPKYKPSKATITSEKTFVGGYEQFIDVPVRKYIQRPPLVTRRVTKPKTGVEWMFVESRIKPVKYVTTKIKETFPRGKAGATPLGGMSDMLLVQPRTITRPRIQTKAPTTSLTQATDIKMLTTGEVKSILEQPTTRLLPITSTTTRGRTTTLTPTITMTRGELYAPTITRTLTPTKTLTRTFTRTLTPTTTRTLTPTITKTITETLTPTVTKTITPVTTVTPTPKLKVPKIPLLPKAPKEEIRKPISIPKAPRKVKYTYTPTLWGKALPKISVKEANVLKQFGFTGAEARPEVIFTTRKKKSKKKKKKK